MDEDFGREGRWECRCAHSQRLELNECKVTIRRGGEGIGLLHNQIPGSAKTLQFSRFSKKTPTILLHDVKKLGISIDSKCRN
ncbi:hypothetical protein BpHYR1_004984 [Brachionus plicatilis]|uniref:Uncharacterized protein n=1 Tax=Brachionus plicatilis TaxID=10195 RepID=A0A3M7S2S2_BRAPC|nr:hypothetical protein BpHYR1_004984 [Brachionus plicatilis]